MSAHAQEVAKLEALLARVNSRRGAPRAAAPEAAASAPVPAAPAPVAAAPVAAAPAPMAAVAPVAAAAPRPAAAATPAPAAARAPIPAPAPTPKPAEVAPAASVAATPTAPPPAQARSATSPPPDMEVEVEEGTAEVDLEGIDEDELGDSALSDSVADLDQVAGGGDVPASSRRPIQMQPPLEELAFGDAPEAKAPAHPVPPESRRQVAIPSDFDGELSGVRATPEIPMVAKAPTAPPPPFPPPPVAATPPAAAPPAPLQAEITRPQVAAASPAVFRGAAPAAQPATFGDLLDESLGL